MHSLGVAVFGCGAWLPLLVNRLRSHAFSVEGLWCSGAAIASDYAKQLQIPFHTDKVDQLLLHRPVHIILIVCPHLQTRFEILAKSFRIGKQT
jgi:predicted dehydrogenase